MASNPAVQPLRISKGSSPQKTAQPRALADIGAGNKRRNSPSYNQATRKMIVSRDSSPFTGDENSSFLSPTLATGNKSTRSLWSQHDRENNHLSSSRFDSETSLVSRSPSPGTSPRRRPSVEKLLNAGRVRGSNIFAMEKRDEYDPTAVPIVERPSANRPLSQQLANNSFHRYDSLKKETNHLSRSSDGGPVSSPGHMRNKSETSFPLISPSKEACETPLPSSPEKFERACSRDSPSPTKSSIARMSMFDKHATQFDPENGTWSDEEGALTPRARSLHRQNKSVTFGAEPPSMYEYEEQTPEPSLEASSREGSWDTEEIEEQDYSFERGSSLEPDKDDSFDADLENADKTPVVLPQHWTRMSPDVARTDLVDEGDDVFEGSPEPTSRAILTRSESVTSNGSNRPLPALPGVEGETPNQSALTTVGDRASRLSMGLPKPARHASCSKEEINRLKKQSSVLLRDEIEKARGQDPIQGDNMHGSVQELGEGFVVKNLDTGERIDFSVHEQEVPVEDSVIRDLDSFTAPRISRESILKKVRNTKYDFEDLSDDELDESEVRCDGRPSYAELAKYDPDVPIPSRETSRETSDNFEGTHRGKRMEGLSEAGIKAEPADFDDFFDMAAVPEAPSLPNNADEFEHSVLIHRMQDQDDEEDDSESTYSLAQPEDDLSLAENSQISALADGKETLDQAMGLLSVTDYAEQICKHAPKSIVQQESSKPNDSFKGLPQYLSTDDYDFGMKDYITPSPPPTGEREFQDPHQNIRPTPHQSLVENEEASQLEPPSALFAMYNRNGDKGSPNSVFHRPSSRHSGCVSEPVSPVDERQLSPDRNNEPVSPVEIATPVLDFEPEIPERRSTIKTSGKLKTRPSASRAELEDIRAQLSTEDAKDEPIPALPRERHEADSAFYLERKTQVPFAKAKDGRQIDLSLSIPSFGQDGKDECGLGDLDAVFDRVIEGQKKGYLTRENTKVVVASNRSFSNETTRSNDSDANPTSPAAGDARPLVNSGSSKPSSRKPSAEQWMKTEPWNGTARRKSQRNASAQKPFSHAVAPPLPGKESALGRVDEDFATQTNGGHGGEVADNVERGRLFVKVVSVKELDLPLPRNDRLYFQLTLDNGLHCVTTSNLELSRTASIGQEFELVVLNDLDFQLTLTTKLPEPRKEPEEVSRPQRSPQKAKQGAFSKLLSTPKKRAERERQDREAMEAEERWYQQQLQRKRVSVQPTAWDRLHELVNSADGSFARSYVNLAAHEENCFGRQLTVDVPCYNEWALERDQAVVSSVRSKGRDRGGEVRKPPYIIGKLEIQLLYVPKPKGVPADTMPKSMNGAIREMNKASERVEVSHEGHLSQQGGDCTHWRRRFFRLQGSKLTAYHEHTHQKRAVINLSKASRLVDDRSTLVADPNPTASPIKGRRRKSAFAEEDEGYQYVEEGFRIRFGNGETIDFYADSSAQKEEWMGVIAQMIGKPDPGAKKASWTDVVLARERSEGKPNPTQPSKDLMMARHEIQTQDFTAQTKEAVVTTTASRPISPPEARMVERKPISGFRSAGNSPVKAGPPNYKAPDPPKEAMIDGAKERPKSMVMTTTVRPGTPPLEPRKGHRARNAVKSMIF